MPWRETAPRINTIEVASALVQLLHGLRWNPLMPASIKMTSLSAGNEAGNVIPDFAVFTLDLRAQSNSHMEELVQNVEQLAGGIGSLYGASISLERGMDAPAAELNSRAIELMTGLLKKQ
nr:peptidase dimerization domain-containing protein [Desulforamulus aquiferis]